MSSRLVKCVLVLGIVFGLAAAHGADLTPGEKLMKFRDHGCFYAEAAGAARSAIPLSELGTIPEGAEYRVIFQVTSIFNDLGTPEFDTSSPTELTGVIYDLELVQVVSSGNVFVMDFAPLGRNPITSDVDGDIATLPGGYVAGGVTEIYEGPSGDYTADPGSVPNYDTKLPATPPVPFDSGNAPGQWSEGGAGHSGAVGADTMVTVTDGDYWLATVMLDLNYLVSAGVVNPPSTSFATGAVLRIQFDQSSGTGSGFAYANVVGGSFADQIDRARLGPLTDLALLFDVAIPIYAEGELKDTLSYQGVGQWTIDSQDPIVFFVKELTAAIGDRVWEDLDEDGIQDAGEPGVEGVTVNLYTCADTLVASTTTDANGLYLFDGLTPGDYYVEFVLPDGYAFTLQDQGADDALDSDADPTTGQAICTGLEGGETDLTWDAGLVQTATGEGFTPGYWRNHLDDWVGYSPGDSYEAVFGVDLTGRLDGLTLLEGVRLGGGHHRALIRHSVAALLNAAHPNVDYAYTEAEVIAMVQDAFATGDFETAKNEFEQQNELGGDIDD
ncbi:MAG: SdrD B-like domain-containing protein [Candidatus Brocadiia bacterium]